VSLNLATITKGIRETIGKHSPEILTGLGIAGMITTTVMAVRATPKALELIDKVEYESDAGKLTPIELIKVTWKCYIPSAITCGLSVACLIGATSVNIRRRSALATAFALSESALREYQGKIIETIGEKKEQSVRDAIAKDAVDRNPVSNREVIITDKGNTLCLDIHSGRYFKSDIEKLKKAENVLNRLMLDEGYVSLNDFYYEIGLKNTKQGDELGWAANDGLIDLDFSCQLAEDGTTPCVVLDYRVAPRYDYQKR
jgi:hypothetical protein